MDKKRMEGLSSFIQSLQGLEPWQLQTLEAMIEHDLMLNIPGGYGAMTVSNINLERVDDNALAEFFREMEENAGRSKLAGFPPKEPPIDDDDDDDDWDGEWEDDTEWTWLVEVNKRTLAMVSIVCGTISLVSYMRGREAQRKWVDKWTMM